MVELHILKKMKITVLNKQQKHPVKKQTVLKLVQWLSKRLAAKTPSLQWNEINVLLVDDTIITNSNREYFGKNSPTDVITFRYDPIPGEEEAYSGDLLINVDRAIEEGFKRGNISRELALYIAHGINHLSGEDDDTPAKRKKMRAAENAWLREAGKLHLTENLINENL